VLTQLHEFYKLGAMIDWDPWYEENQLHKVPLPTYPFQGQHYWISRNKQLYKRKKRYYWDTFKVNSPQIEEDVYQVSLSLEEYPVLLDHYYFEYPMLAASALMSWILEVAFENYQIEACRIDDFTFMQALILPKKGDIDIQLVVKPAKNNRYGFTIRSYHEDFLIQEEKWVEHAYGYLAINRDVKIETINEETMLDILKEKTLYTQDQIYPRLAKHGLVLSSSYQCIESISKNDKEVLATLSTRHMHTTVYRWQYHPGILDALFQAVQMLLPYDLPPDMIFLLSQWQSVNFKKECQSPRFIYAKIVERPSDNQLFADVKLLNDKKQIIAAVERVQIQKASEIIQTSEMLHYQAWQYRMDWQPLPKEMSEVDKLEGNILLYADKSGLADALIPLLEKNSMTVTRVEYDDFSKEQLANVDDSIKGVLFLWGVDSSQQLDPEKMSQESSLICGPLVSIIQHYYAISVPLIFITQGAVGTYNPVSHLNALQGAIWGMGRTVSVERGSAPCYLIDLDPDDVLTEQASNLSELLLSHPKEEQLAIRNKKTLMPRLDYYRESPPKRLGIDFSKSYTIAHHPNKPEPWAVEHEKSEKKPGDDEVLVDVNTSGLSYRDYLEFSGLLTDDNPHIGDDFVGVVNICGKNVSEFNHGDHVMGFHQGTLSSSVVVNKNALAILPKTISMEQAAAWPLVYVTAYYMLDELAGLKNQQTVFIPSAGSGVGFAAVQIAKQRNAKIITTVKGAEKVVLLQRCGVNHVIDMAKKDWEKDCDEMLSQTTLDAIIAGTYKEVTERVSNYIAPEGHILDLSGGRFEYSEEIVQHAGFKPVQMYEVIKDKAEFVKKALTVLCEYFQDSDFIPMPIKTYPIVHLPRAMEQLANPHHLSKAVLCYTEAKDELFSSNVTYVVVGGLGALGFYFIPWLLENGAKHICVVDLKESDESLQRIIRKRYGTNQQVNYYPCDITDTEKVNALFEKIVKDMPKIKGIFNIATMLHDAPIPQQTLASFQKILHVKSTGSLNLHLNSLDLDLDYFVMFSSIASLMGSQNQLNYSAANAYQDSLACHRNALGLPALAINWSPWQVGIGAYMGETAAKVWESWGSFMLDPEIDLEALQFLLRLDTPQIALFAIDWAIFTNQFDVVPAYLRTLHDRFMKKAGPKKVAEKRFLKELCALSEDECKTTLQDFLQEELATCLHIEKEQIDNKQPFAVLGIDSLMSINIRDHLQEKLGEELPAMLMFTYPSIDVMSDFIIEGFVEPMKAELGAEGEAAEPEEESKAEEEISEEEMSDVLDATLKEAEDKLRGKKK